MQLLKARTELLETERSEMTSGLFLKRADYVTALSERTDFGTSGSTRSLILTLGPFELLCFT